jgi:FAD/FMN-containing dehydrogenase
MDWFKATVGGIGLTGIIYSCKIKLRKIDGPWLEAESVAFASIEEFFELSDASEAEWEYTAAWIDCLHKKNIRGIFERANHISSQKNFKNRQYSFPFTPPFSLVNKFSLSLFNPMYFYLKSFFAKKRIVPYTKFLHPLDNILNWNRIYGPKGFYQFQCVLPAENGKEAIEEMLSIISSLKMGSFLVVIKTFSNFKPFGLLSFANPGVTFALDFPNQGDKTKLLFQKLQRIVERSKGKIYLAKDAMMDRDFFESSYPLLNIFKSFRDPHISSQMSKRLLGD